MALFMMVKSSRSRMESMSGMSPLRKETLVSTVQHLKSPSSPPLKPSLLQQSVVQLLAKLLLHCVGRVPGGEEETVKTVVLTRFERNPGRSM